MRILTTIALSALAGVSAPTLACAAPSASEVLDANKTATHGDALDGKATLKTEYAYSGQGMTGKVVSLTDVKDGRFVDDAAIGPATEVQGFDGIHAWDKDTSGTVSIQDGGDQRELAVNEAYRRANLWWRADRGGAAITADGEKAEAGAIYDVLTVTPKGGKNFDAWFDAKTHLLSRIVEIQNVSTITTTMSDYRAVDGMEFPGKELINNGDAKYDQIMTVTKAAFVSAQPADAYAAPIVILNDFSIADGAKETTFPFKLLNNHIYANISVNGKGPYQFIFDTGGVNVVTPPLAAELGLKSEGQMQGNGGGAGHMDVGLTKVSSLQLGDATVKDQVFAVLPLNSMSNVEGVGMPGMVGYETFRRFVTRVDYGNGTITLIRPDAFDPKNAGVAVPIRFDGNTIEAPATYNGVPGTFTIDTGARHGLMLNTPFVAAHAQFAKYQNASEAVTGWGIGGATRSHVILGDGLVLGGQTIAKPVVLLSTDTKGDNASNTISGNIGGGVLKRFIVTLDYGHTTMYLKPVTTAVSDIDTFDRSGVWINQSSAGYKVVDVTKGTPADQAGLKVDDEILAVNGKPASAIPLYEIRSQLRNDAPGTVVTFSVRRGADTRDIKITLRDLI
ncbi:MAG TPA: aspartyl protease family protein [Rhizomicrobium sp.]